MDQVGRADSRGSAPRLAPALLGALAAVVAGLQLAGPTRAAANPASQVNVFTGTDAGAQDFGTGGGAGNTFPGAVLPFGMVQFSPDTVPAERAFGGGYTYRDNRIKGFSLRHMSGPGCAAYQDFPLTPTNAPITGSPAKPLTIDLQDSYLASFSHTAESGQPGYYRVKLSSAAQPIGAELTATRRTAVGRFTYPHTHTASLLINAAGSAMGASEADVRIDPPHREISGSAASGQFCYQQNRYRLYFAAEFNRPFTTYGTWRGPLLVQPGSRSSSDTIGGPPLVYQPIPGGPQGVKDGGVTAQTGAYATFDTTGERTVEVRVGVSSVSVANARANLQAESAGRKFGAVRNAARMAWNGMLDRIAVRGGSTQTRRLFYTQLYRALLHPSTFSDANGQYAGFDGRVHGKRGHIQYADFSGWDTYRTQMPLVAMLAPHRASDMVRSLLADARDSGYLPKWSQANGHTHVMTGDPADLLIADAWAFGARSFDSLAALDAMVKGATRYGKASTQPDYYERPALPDYLRLGYVPHERNTDVTGQTFMPEAAWGSASTTMEYALADFAIARLAAARCDRATYRNFMRRSANWRNVFDAKAGYVQPRMTDGSFKPVGPTGQDGFVEGNAAQYTLFAPHDPAGLFKLLGGRKASARRLDAFFSQLNSGPAEPHAFLGNEPTLDTPWLYNWLGQPYKAEAIVHRAMLKLYSTRPGGYPGNDDLGSMSSWWVFGALGLYPAVPGTDVLAIGSPLFPRITLHLPGARIEIIGRRAGVSKPYVSSLELDRKTLSRSWIRFGRLRRGAKLRFELAGQPKRSFGSGGRLAPPSFGPNAPMTCAPHGA